MEGLAEEKYKQGTSYLMPFEKMHGLGNDFVIVNASHLPTDSNVDYETALTRKICDRNRGIGADGLIIIDQVKESEHAIRSWRFYNSDGTIAEMCGNGVRCAAKYIYEHGLSGEETSFKLETLAGDIGLELLDNEMVRVDMGAARSIEEGLSLLLDDLGILPEKAHMQGLRNSDQAELTEPSMMTGQDERNAADGSLQVRFDYDFISMGNPHAITFVEDIEAVKAHGPEIETHKNFPQKTNVEFAQIISPTKIKLVVWERGCGFTEACGTGACATVVSAVLRGHVQKDTDIEVELPGGTLVIRWDSVAETIFMTGAAELSFIGYHNIVLLKP
ncbi:MAG: diaminopimelate epimerase [Cyanobacteria bacterium]|nr:diaminopimelate epimerase [Cyanobacteriota bacterium]MDA1020427.1 diaminopimelate epimerase [Cyanobacteriota bacterium]